MADPRRIVVLGAGLAGAQTAVRLRAQGFTGQLSLVGEEVHEPYDRPPLSKAVLTGSADETRFPHDWAALGVELLLGRAVTGVRPGDRVVETTAGELPYDGLVIATGAEPVRLPGPGEQVTVRTIDDARALRDRLRPGARVCLVGASWIGAEVATVAVAARCAVTCIEAGPAPLAQALGPEIATRTLPWWDGVDLRLGTGVTEVVDGGLTLRDGTEIAADVVVVGVGVRPATRFLEGSGIKVDRGVLTDEWLRASEPGVVAVGDVARWESRRFRTRMAAEHWDHALRGADVAAASLLRGDEEPTAGSAYDPVPYFWSEQWGHMLQYVGHHDPADTTLLRAADAAAGWSACWLDGEGRLTALLAVDRPKDMVQGRRAIEAGALPDPARLADAAVAVRDA